jgi:hypothetical protein
LRRPGLRVGRSGPLLSNNYAGIVSLHR